MVNVGKYTSPMDPMGYYIKCLKEIMADFFLKQILADLLPKKKWYDFNNGEILDP